VLRRQDVFSLMCVCVCVCVCVSVCVIVPIVFLRVIIVCFFLCIVLCWRPEDNTIVMLSQEIFCQETFCRQCIYDLSVAAIVVSLLPTLAFNTSFSCIFLYNSAVAYVLDQRV